MSLVRITRHPLSEPDVPVCRHPAPHLRMFEDLSSWESSSVELVVTTLAENQCFSVFRCHHVLPECLPFCDIFHFPYMVHLERPLFCFTVFELPSIEPLDNFRPADCPEI